MQEELRLSAPAVPSHHSQMCTIPHSASAPSFGFHLSVLPHPPRPAGSEEESIWKQSQLSRFKEMLHRREESTVPCLSSPTQPPHPNQMSSAGSRCALSPSPDGSVLRRHREKENPWGGDMGKGGPTSKRGGMMSSPSVCVQQNGPESCHITPCSNNPELTGDVLSWERGQKDAGEPNGAQERTNSTHHAGTLQQCAAEHVVQVWLTSNRHSS